MKEVFSSPGDSSANVLSKHRLLLEILPPPVALHRSVSTLQMTNL